MRSINGLSLALVTAGALTLAGCGGSGSTVAAAPVTPVIAGEYTGTVTDSVTGSQPVATTLSQHGASVGGTFTIGSGAATSTESIAWTLAGSTVSGSGLMDVGASTCAFTMSGTYANNQITGSYSASSGCSGRTGTFTLAQGCTDPATSDSRRAQGVLPPC